MDKLGVKATFYDFFGYLISGVSALIATRILILNIRSGFEYDKILTLFTIDNIYQFITILVFSYLLGHLISTLSFYLIEKLIINKIKYLNNYFKVKNLLSGNLYGEFEKRFQIHFKSKYSDSSFRLIVCFVEEKHKEIYSTAFIFLSFYGMARNISFIFLFSFIVEMILILKTHAFPYYTLVYIIIGIISFFHYIRFRKYFFSNIVNAFLIDISK